MMVDQISDKSESHLSRHDVIVVPQNSLWRWSCLDHMRKYVVDVASSLCKVNGRPEI